MANAAAICGERGVGLVGRSSKLAPAHYMILSTPSKNAGAFASEGLATELRGPAGAKEGLK
ncbi:hypothetical protein [Pseudomonas syringae group genomosp. 3]|uniref:hypothetical protein n=1 Tax=Pseudomonas syringae group genomosp. 3 TaxID=251701 RepID=UPI00071052AE|nr:hypothetical protein [Pseudomonas syringae group genomosp. 3]